MKLRVDLTGTLLEMVRNGRCEERYVDSVYDAIDYINANKEEAEQGKTYVCLDDIKQFPIRKDHCDKEHGNPHFIYGVETVMEYIDTLPRYKREEEISGDEWDDYDRCYECRGYGDDYIINDDGELESWCDHCGLNPNREDE